MSTFDHPIDRAAACVAGGRNGLAKALGVTPSAIGNWKKRGVPIEQCLAIERVTNAQVTRRDLCSVWARIWPELIDAQRPAITPQAPQAAQEGV